MNDVEKKLIAELESQTRRLEAQTRALTEGLEKSREQAQETARGTYELRLDDFHSERGYRRIKEVADAAGMSFREAYKQLANELRPKVPEVGEETTPPESVLMSAEEEQEAYGVTNQQIEDYARERGLSFRDAWVEIRTEGR